MNILEIHKLIEWWPLPSLLEELLGGDEDEEGGISRARLLSVPAYATAQKNLKRCLRSLERRGLVELTKTPIAPYDRNFSILYRRKMGKKLAGIGTSGRADVTHVRLIR